MEQGPEQGQVEAWKQGWWSKLPTWARWAIGVAGAIILLGAGAAIGSGNEDDLQSELDEAKVDLAVAVEERDVAEAEAKAVLDRKDEIIREARSEASEISGKLDTLRGEVSATKGELAESESSLASAEHEEALSSFSDGIWKSEVDFMPGTYRAPGGESCYWALLGSADTSDIVNNGGFSPNQTITIDSPWFETSNCGTWERVE